MLTAIRSKASSWIIKILFGILVLSFAVWGIGDIFRSPGRQAAAIEVGDASISGSAIEQAFQEQLQALQQQFGGQLDREQALQLGLGDEVVRRLVNDTLQQIEIQRLGIVVPDDLVRARIEAAPAFRNSQGQFDRDLYGLYLQQTRQSEAQLVASVRAQIAEDQLFAPLRAGAAPPKTLVDAIHGYRGEARVAKTLLIPSSAAGAIADPAPDVLQTYYDENQDAFMAPEYRSVTLVLLSPEDLAKNIEVPEERLREEYETQKNQLTVPERRHIRQFVLSDEAAAASAAERLKTEPFDQVATDLTGGAPIDLGTVAREGLPAELAEAAFTPTAPGIVGPVETALGLHMLNVEAIEPGRVPSFEEVREQLRSAVALEQATSEITEVANDLDDALAGGATLAQAADQLNLPAEKIGAVDASGKAPDGTEVAPMAAHQVLRAMAFGTDEGQTTDLTELEDGSYAILHIDGVQAAAPRPLEEVRNDVVKVWLEAEEAKALAAKAEAAAERVRGGATLETIANELGLAVQTSSAFTRETGDPAAAIDRRLSATLFALKSGEVATAVAEGGHVIAQLTEVKAPEAPAEEAAAALEGELRQALESDLRAQYVRALQREIPVSIDQPAIDSLFQ